MAQLVNARPVIDKAGNIAVHGRGGLLLTYQRQDANQVLQDIHADVLFFEISGICRVALGAGSDNTKRVILVEDTVIAQLPLRQAIPFALRDETSDPVIIRWDGLITARGYDGAPP